MAAGSSVIGGQASANTLVLDLRGPAPSVSVIQLAPLELAAGSAFEMTMDLHNATSDNFSSISLNPLARGDDSENVRLAVDRCSLPWESAGDDDAGGQVFECAGAQTSVLSGRSIGHGAAPLVGLAALRTGGTDHLRLRLQASPTGPDTVPTEVELKLLTV